MAMETAGFKCAPETGPATKTAIIAPQPKAKLTERKLASLPCDKINCATPEHPNKTRMAVPINSAIHSATRRIQGLVVVVVSKGAVSEVSFSPIRKKNHLHGKDNSHRLPARTNTSP